MTFLRNVWYVAAWSDEVGETPFARTILGEQVLLYRQEDGAPAAIGNICPHRFAPLSMGSRVGDAIECPYHGLRFGANGQCVHNPHGNGPIPKTIRIKSYPIVERHRCDWIWMGDPARADPALIPDFSYLDREDFVVVRGPMLPTAANYELVADNLLDLSHVAFVHREFHELEAFDRREHKVTVAGNTVHSNYLFPNGRYPFMGRYLGDREMKVDHWLEMRWDAPGVMHLKTGAAPTGRPRSEGIELNGTHLLTPETGTSTLYFYASARGFRTDDEEINEGLRTWQKVGFGGQDKPLIEAIQATMGATTDLMALRPLLLPIDSGAVRARRVIEQLRAAEAQVAA